MPQNMRRLDAHVTNDPEYYNKGGCTSREKCLTALCVILFILAAVFLSLMLYFLLREPKTKRLTATDEEYLDVCITKDCAKTAANLIEAIDNKADPCKDFFKFGCGNFVKKNPVPDDKLVFSTSIMFNKYYNLQMQDVIETLDPVGQPEVVSKVQELYHVCLNISYQEKIEMAAFRNFTTDVLFWPLAIGRTWSHKYTNINEFLEQVESSGFISNHLYKIMIVRLPTERKFIFMISPGDLITFSDEAELTPSMATSQNAQIKLLENLVHEFGNLNNAGIKEDIQVMKKTSDIAMKYNSESSESSVEEEPEEMTIKELTEQCDNKVDWLKIINRRLQKVNYEISENETVYVKNIKVLLALVEHFEKVSWRAFANIIGWKTIFPDMIQNAGPLGAKLYHDYLLEDPHGKAATSESRSEICTDFTRKFYPAVYTRIFVNKFIDKNDKSSADEMIQLVAKAYRKMISESKWVDEKTKSNAVKKADKITRHVGYPEYIFDDKRLEHSYAHMPQLRSTHILNYIYHEQIEEFKHMYRNISGEIDNWEYQDPLEVNAGYMAQTNSIWFPTAILQMPYFDNNRLAAVNFGTIGTVIGHEIGHAFDNSGSTYDEDGKERDWWTNATRQIFDDKGKCFIKQYDKFCPEALQGGEEPICVKGAQTLGENLADATGLAAAFSAYKMWVEKHGEENRLPGLHEYSPEQLFFISYAYEWCENIPPYNWRQRYDHDEHSPAEYRIIGALSNTKEFREAFSCPEGPMNRGKDTCTVW